MSAALYDADGNAIGELFTLTWNPPSGEDGCAAEHIIFKPVRLVYVCALAADHEGDHRWTPR